MDLSHTSFGFHHECFIDMVSTMLAMLLKKLQLVFLHLVFQSHAQLAHYCTARSKESAFVCGQ